MKEQIHCIIHGRVQMVGFRFFAVRQAQKFGVTGYVRNLPDGTVEVLAQGDSADIDGYASTLKRGPSSAQVDYVDIDRTQEISEEYDAFDVRW